MGVVGDGDDGLGGVTGLGDQVAGAGTDSLALQVNVDTLLLGLLLLQGVLLNTVDELLAGAGVLDVLNADGDTLLEVAVVDTLVQEDTDGGLGDVVDDTSLTVVDLVGHTIEEKSLSSYSILGSDEWCRGRIWMWNGMVVRLVANVQLGEVMRNEFGCVLTPSERHR